MSRASLAAVAVVVVVVAAGAGCTLTPPDFGRPCDDKTPCSDGYVCFQSACVRTDFPLLDAGSADVDAGEADAGQTDAGPDDAGSAVAGDTCGTAITLALGDLVDGDTTGAFDDNRDRGQCAFESPGPDVVYQVTMPATPRRLHVVAQASDPNNEYNLVVKVYQDCLGGPLACDTALTTPVDVVVDDAPAGPLFIMVDSVFADESGPFTLRATAE